MPKSKPHFSLEEGRAMIRLESNKYQSLANHFPGSSGGLGSCGQGGVPPSMWPRPGTAVIREGGDLARPWSHFIRGDEALPGR